MAEIETFIDAVLNQDFSQAAPMFNELIGDKMNDALEQEKISVADQIFNGAEPEEEQLELDLEDGEVEETEDEDITDEELDAAIDEVEVEEE